jgi:hypothetical protein
MCCVQAGTTAFTYQGRLEDGTRSAAGFYDLRFGLFNVPDGGSASGTVTNAAVPVTNGLFAVTLDFGAAFDGTGRWLEISVRTNGASSFVTLAPRQSLTPAPGAIYASSAGAVPAAGIQGSILPANIASGSITAEMLATNAVSVALTNLDASQLTRGKVSLARLPGSVLTNNWTGTVGGTTLDLDGNLNLPATTASAGSINSGGTRVMHFTGYASSFVGADAGNFRITGNYNTAHGFQSLYNNTSGSGNTAAGAGSLYLNTNGFNNTASGHQALYSNRDGSGNTADGITALYSNTSGYGNTASGSSALFSNTVGHENTADGDSALFSNTSGNRNIALGWHAGYNITTGDNNIAIGNPGLATDTNIIRIGTDQTQSHLAGVINGNGAGLTNLNTTNLTGTFPASRLSGAAGTLSATNIICSGSITGNGAGLTNLNASQLSTGTVPLARLPAAAITNTQTGVTLSGTFGGNGSGLTNLNASQISSGLFSGNGGGLTNLNASQLSAGVLGDARLSTNVVLRGSSPAFGNTVTIQGDLFAERIIIGSSHKLTAPHAGIAGGSLHTNLAASSAIGGGCANAILTNADYSTISGGYLNTILTNALECTIGGGVMNAIQARALQSAIGGGVLNTIQPDATNATIGGGCQNTIQTNARCSTIGGGYNNTIRSGANYAVVPGGNFNVAGGDYSFAAGRRAKATNDGAFVWGSSTNLDVCSTNTDSVTFSAGGGFRIFSNDRLTAGAYLAPGGTAWSVICDRNAKKNFAPVSGLDVLDKLAVLPVLQWNYTWEPDDAPPHLGPMAQDFKAAFYPGNDNTSITTLEFDGVALAAIQGLDQKVNREVRRLQEENASLKQELAEIKSLVARLASKPDQHR